MKLFKGYWFKLLKILGEGSKCPFAPSVPMPLLYLAETVWASAYLDLQLHHFIKGKDCYFHLEAHLVENWNHATFTFALK